MPKFEVEVVYEPTGTHMNFVADLDNWDEESPITEEDAWQFIMDELSIVVNQIEE